MTIPKLDGAAAVSILSLFRRRPRPASVQVPFDVPPKGSRQFFKGRLALSRRIEAHARLWEFCGVCGDPLPRLGRGRTCHSCRAWAAHIEARQDRANLRRWFGSF